MPEPRWLATARELRSRKWSYEKIRKYLGHKNHHKVMYWLDPVWRAQRLAKSHAHYKAKGRVRDPLVRRSYEEAKETGETPAQVRARWNRKVVTPLTIPP